MDNLTHSPVKSNSQEGPIFHLDDLARMRHAYDKACHDGLMPESSDAQRTSLAKAIVSAYRAGLTEDELVISAMNLVR